tara:strand:+ start:1947 stop:2099 length:153 start_codon:yes stop_codon:yes gene_type:complete
MCTIEQAKQMIKERKIQERNMLINMKREIKEHKIYFKYYKSLGETIWNKY